MVQLSRDQRIRVVLVAEDLPLPECIIGVLHLERSPIRNAIRNPSGVSNHDIPSQRTHREPVRCDVMHNEGENKCVRPHLEQLHTERYRHCHIEPCQSERQQCLFDPSSAQSDWGEIKRYL